MTQNEINRTVAEKLEEVQVLKCVMRPRDGQIFVAPIPEPKKQMIIRPDGAGQKIVMEEKRAIVVAVGPGDWSADGSQRCEIGLKPLEVVSLVRSEMVVDGSVEFLDPMCPVPLVAIHSRMAIGSCSYEDYLRETMYAMNRFENEKQQRLSNGEA